MLPSAKGELAGRVPQSQVVAVQQWAGQEGVWCLPLDFTCHLSAVSLIKNQKKSAGINMAEARVSGPAVQE